MVRLALVERDDRLPGTCATWSRAKGFGNADQTPVPVCFTHQNTRVHFPFPELPQLSTLGG